MALMGCTGVAFASKATTPDIIYDNDSVCPNVVTVVSGTDLLISADDFTLSRHSVIADIHWSGVYGTTNTPAEADNLTILILADDGGTPDGFGPSLSPNRGFQHSRSHGKVRMVAQQEIQA